MAENNLNQLEVAIFTGEEKFLFNDKELPLSLLDFWKWANSNLLSNTLRGILAEFIVASAIGLDKKARTEWDSYDLKTSKGLMIELKSASYIQSWKQNGFSNIIFKIAPTRGWEAETNTYAATIRRQAHIYVFALLHHQNKITINPLAVDQWTFHILESEKLDEKCGLNKTIGLNPLLRLNPIVCKYEELQENLTVFEKKYCL